MKEQFIQLLQSTQRPGMDKVINYLEKYGFFTAPASISHHLNNEGGLLQHSMTVYETALALRKTFVELKPELEKELPDDSLIIAALLHDICKADVYKKAQKWRKDKDGRWETYDSYETDYSLLPVGHGEKSVLILLSLGLKMNKREIAAIRWHMGAWNLTLQRREEMGNINEANSHIPLVPLLQAADSLSTHLLE